MRDLGSIMSPMSPASGLQPPRKQKKMGMFPGSSMVERSAVNRNVAGSSPARGANLSSLGFNHLEKISPRLIASEKCSCPSSHFAAAFFRAGNVVALCCFGAVRK
jgi:hypothetical protein